MKCPKCHAASRFKGDDSDGRWRFREQPPAHDRDDDRGHDERRRKSFWSELFD